MQLELGLADAAVLMARMIKRTKDAAPELLTRSVNRDSGRGRSTYQSSSNSRIACWTRPGSLRIRSAVDSAAPKGASGNA